MNHAARSYDAESISLSATRLALNAQLAMMFSAKDAADYLQQHTDGVPVEAESAMLLGVARLQWLLKDGRRRIAKRLSEGDIGTLLNCFQADLFSSQDFDCIASMLCDDFGIALADADQSCVADLVATIRSLDPVELVALGDALEQAWLRTQAWALGGGDVLQPRPLAAVAHPPARRVRRVGAGPEP